MDTNDGKLNIGKLDKQEVNLDYENRIAPMPSCYGGGLHLCI